MKNKSKVLNGVVLFTLLGLSIILFLGIVIKSFIEL
jgi:hypothetical protein